MRDTRRWDVLVLRNPSAPGECFMKRLVGLPGETFQIKEGAVWADGMKLTPPDAIRGIQ